MTEYKTQKTPKYSQWNYGPYEWYWAAKVPTQDSFERWKHDFLSIPEVKDYEVWVSGGFLQNWKTKDIDITLFGPKNYKIIQKLLYKGTDIGIKHNVFVDIVYQITPYPFLSFTDDMSLTLHEKIVLTNQLYINDKLKWKAEYTKSLPEGLYLIVENYPHKNQLKRKYTQKPICIKQ